MLCSKLFPQMANPANKNIAKIHEKTPEGRTQKIVFFTKYAPKIEVSQLPICDTCVHVYGGPL